MAYNQSVSVQIFGQVYRLRTEDDPERVTRVARMVDDRLNKISDQGASADSYRIAVLAALELADELDRLTESHSKLREEVAKRGGRLAALLESLETDSQEDRKAGGQPPLAAD